MGLGPVSYGATNLKSGTDADKPANPNPGDIYVSIDTSIVYVCYVAGSWVNATPERSNFDKIMLSDLSKNWYDLTAGTDAYFNTSVETSQANGAYSTVWKRFQGIKINALPDGVETLRVRYTYRLTQVDMGSIFTKVQVNGVDVPGASIPESSAGATINNTDSPIFNIPVQPGDLVQVYGYIKNKGTAYVSNLRILGTKKDMLVYDVSNP